MAASPEGYISGSRLISSLAGFAVLVHSFVADIQYAVFANYSGVGCDLFCYIRAS